MCIENFICCMENCLKTEVCLLLSHFVPCMEKFSKNSQQQSDSDAYEFLDAINKNLLKVSGNLRNHVNFLCKLDDGHI